MQYKIIREEINKISNTNYQVVIETNRFLYQSNTTTREQAQDKLQQYKDMLQRNYSNLTTFKQPIYQSYIKPKRNLITK